MNIELIHGDCVQKLKELPDNSVDSIVTDPPYGLSFMGKHWDYDVPSEEVWRECLRVLKPGGHLLSFAGTRTQHRMAVRIEDAGFEIRDMIAWIYGSGFPKSLNIGKAVDKRGGNAGLTAQIGEAIKKARLARGMTASECDRLFCGGTTNWSWFEGRPTGQRAPTPETFALIVEAWPELAPLAEAVAEAEREVIGVQEKAMSGWNMDGTTKFADRDITAPATEAAKQWEGWGTALKPALEPITVARKPLGTPAVDVQKAVEYVMMENGFNNIIWQKENLVTKKGTKTNTEDAGLVSEKTTLSIGNAIESKCANELKIGINKMAVNSESTVTNTTKVSDRLFSNNMERSVSVVEKQSQNSSPSTTSMAEEQNTEKQLTEKSMPKSGGKDFLLNTASFVGTAIGALGLGHVLIKHNDDGSYTWPSELPKFIPSQSLTVAQNVLTHGTGGINVDGCRVGTEEIKTTYDMSAWREKEGRADLPETNKSSSTHTGRFPANLIHDGSEEVVELFPSHKPHKMVRNRTAGARPFNNNGEGTGYKTVGSIDDPGGSAARFFYCAKSSKRDRNSGLGGILTVKYNRSIIPNKEICKEENTVVVQLLQKVISEQAPVSFNIGECGESITAQCHQDSLSITKTTISKIIESRILNSLMLSLTNEYTEGANSETASGGNPAGSVESLRKWILDTTNGKTELALGASRVALQMLLEINKGAEWKERGNFHSTVKPTDLMRYLCRLVTPKGGTVLDPFMGSGSTGKAAKIEGFNFIGIEREAEYIEIARSRIEQVENRLF